MTQEQKIQIFQEMKNIEDEIITLQKMQEQGQGDWEYNFKLNLTVNEVHTRMFERSEATWKIIHILGLDSEFFAWERRQN